MWLVSQKNVKFPQMHTKEELHKINEAVLLSVCLSVMIMMNEKCISLIIKCRIA